MKIKSLLLFLFICFIVLLAPSISLAANSETFTDSEGSIYELFDDNTATLTFIDPQYSTIPSSVTANGKIYSITKIGKDALNGITQEQELSIFLNNAPILEQGISFEKISAIYIPQLNTQGYTQANGWPVEKLKNYKITVQPVSPSQPLTAGSITSADTLTIKVTVPTGGFMAYSWYFCDAQGNIVDNETVGGNTNIFQIPTDLTYNNETGTAKEYYFKCVVGTSLTICEESNVVKVVVQPGDYKVSFYNRRFSQQSQTPLVLSVDGQRKLSQTDIVKIPTAAQLEQYKEGEKFVGWTTDGKTVIDINDISSITFEKNTNLYPLWKTKLNFDANGGKFSDGKTIFTTYISNFNILDEEPSEPKLVGYELFGFFYDKSGKNPYEGDILTKETTVYAQWWSDGSTDKKDNIENSSNNENNGNENKSNENVGEQATHNKIINPQTGDNILLFVGLLAISAVGIFTTTKFIKNAKR